MLPYYSIIIAIFVFTGLFAVAWFLRKILRDNKSKSWPHTEASIFYLENKDPLQKMPNINFRYTVSGSIYNQKIEPTIEEVTMPGFANHFKKQYPEGETLKLFYNNDFPKTTTFSPGAKTEDKIILSLCIAAVFVGFYAITI